MANELSTGLTGSTRVSMAEEREHQQTLMAKRVTDIPNDQQTIVDANGRSDNQPVYVGSGARGLATSSSGWLLYKITYDSYNDFSYKQIAYDSWDNRATATYA